MVRWNDLCTHEDQFYDLNVCKIISRLDCESKSNETLREEQEVRADVALNTLEAYSLKDLIFHSIVKRQFIFRRRWSRKGNRWRCWWEELTTSTKRCNIFTSILKQKLLLASFQGMSLSRPRRTICFSTGLQMILAKLHFRWHLWMKYPSMIKFHSWCQRYLQSSEPTWTSGGIFLC